LIGNCIKDVWDEKQTDATISDVWDHLKAQMDTATPDMARDLNRLLVALLPYTANGVYASYFNGPATIDFSNNFIVLELEELKSRKDLQALVLEIIMYRITQEMYLDRSRRKLVIIDEAWDLMGSNTSASFIEAGYRRARKYRGSFGMVTQSVDDFYKNAAAKAAIDNADWLFLLRQKSESIDRLEKEGKLRVDEYLRRILNSVSTEHGMYSEIYVSNPTGSGIGRLLLDPFTMLLYSTRAEDFEAIRSYQAQGLDIVRAIERVLQDRGGKPNEA
jgi:conjugal transfer ATP-binding protein TraC